MRLAKSNIESVILAESVGVAAVKRLRAIGCAHADVIADIRYHMRGSRTIGCARKLGRLACGTQGWLTKSNLEPVILAGSL